MNKLTKCLLLALTLTLGLMAAPASFAQLFISVQVAPPPLPVYQQPPCPAPGYIWTPGYWAWSVRDRGYFWVPGTWVLAPQPGYLWTPGYWAWNDGYYVWRPGYWATTVGFYGGIDYGFGYFGSGYSGGYWRNRAFYYNRAVNNVNITVIRNVYRRDVPRRDQDRRVSYNGGRGGIAVRPPQHGIQGPHVEATREQQLHRERARNDRGQFDRDNHGRPAVTATPRPGAFNGRDQRALGPTQGRPAVRPERSQVQQRTPRQSTSRPQAVPQRQPQPQPPVQRQQQRQPQPRVQQQQPQRPQQHNDMPRQQHGNGRAIQHRPAPRAGAERRDNGHARRPPQ